MVFEGQGVCSEIDLKSFGMRDEWNESRDIELAGNEGYHLHCAHRILEFRNLDRFAANKRRGVIASTFFNITDRNNGIFHAVSGRIQRPKVVWPDEGRPFSKLYSCRMKNFGPEEGSSYTGYLTISPMILWSTSLNAPRARAELFRGKRTVRSNGVFSPW